MIYRFDTTRLREGCVDAMKRGQRWPHLDAAMNGYLAHSGKGWTCSETVPLASSFVLFHLYSEVEARLRIGDCRFQPRAVQKTNEDCPIMDKALLVCLSLALTFGSGFRTRRRD
jgi:hypothetical protein